MSAVSLGFRSAVVLGRLLFTPTQLWKLVGPLAIFAIFMALRYNLEYREAFTFSLVADGEKLEANWWASCLLAVIIGHWLGKTTAERIATPTGWLLPGARDGVLRSVILLGLIGTLVTILRVIGFELGMVIAFTATFMLCFASALCAGLESDRTAVLVASFGTFFCAFVSPSVSLMLAQASPYIYSAFCIWFSIKLLAGEFDLSLWRPRVESTLEKQRNRKLDGVNTPAFRLSEGRRKKIEARTAEALSELPRLLRTLGTTLSHQYGNLLRARLRVSWLFARLDSTGQTIDTLTIALFYTLCVLASAVSGPAALLILVIVFNAFLGRFPLDASLLRQESRADRLHIAFTTVMLRAAGFLAIAVSAILLARWLSGGSSPGAIGFFGRPFAPSPLLFGGVLFALTPLIFLLGGFQQTDVAPRTVRTEPWRFLADSTFFLLALSVSFVLEQQHAQFGNLPVLVTVISLAVITHGMFFVLLRRRYLGMDLVPA